MSTKMKVKTKTTSIIKQNSAFDGGLTKTELETQNNEGFVFKRYVMMLLNLTLYEEIVTSSVLEKTSAATAQPNIPEVVESSVPAPEPSLTTETQFSSSEMTTFEISATMTDTSSQMQTEALSTTLTPTTTASTTTTTSTTTTVRY